MVNEPVSPSSRGHLIVRSHAPLPRFTCVVPVPPPDAPILQLRSTVLAILTGQVSGSVAAENGTKMKEQGRGIGVQNTTSSESGLSYSEHLKQQTVHEWRLKSVVLELNQNALIAPETRSLMEQRQERTDKDDVEREKGFVLSDEHECALLEHGDEVDVWLLEGQEVESLHLPKLASKHVFGLPNQPKLTRAGTILGPPPAYTKEADEDAMTFHPPQARLLEPAEPSSHSSSVSAHPDGQFETNMRHKSAPAGWHRVMVVKTASPAEKSPTNGQTNTDVPLVNALRAVNKRAKPKRLMSEGSNALVDQRAPKPPAPVRHNSALLPNAQSPKNESATSPTPPSSPPLVSNKEILASQNASSSGLTKVERQEREKVRKAGQRLMPSQALVIGPGVQGKVGRVNSIESNRKGSGTASGPARENVEAEIGGKASGEYGNMDAFVSFTAASSEVHQMRQQVQQNGAGHRRMSNRSSTSERLQTLSITPNEGKKVSEDRSNAATKGVGMDNGNGNGKGGGKPKSSTFERFVKVSEKPEVPPIRNLAPFTDEERGSDSLMPMPMPVPAVRTPSMPSTSSSPVPRIPSPDSTMSQRELQLANDAAIAQALSETLVLTPSSEKRADIGTAAAVEETAATSAPKLVRKRTTAEAETNATSHPFTVSAPPPLRSADSSSPSLPVLSRQSSDSPSNSKRENAVSSKAERRFNEVKRALEAEKERQSEQERARRDKARKVSEEKVKTLEKIELERRQKEEKMRWQLWDEVRLRQAKEQAR